MSFLFIITRGKIKQCYKKTKKITMEKQNETNKLTKKNEGKLQNSVLN